MYINEEEKLKVSAVVSHESVRGAPADLAFGYGQDIYNIYGDHLIEKREYLTSATGKCWTHRLKVYVVPGKLTCNTHIPTCR